MSGPVFSSTFPGCRTAGKRHPPARPLHRRYDGCAACGRPPVPHVHLSELVPLAERPQSCRCGTRATADDRGCCDRQATGGESQGAAVAERSGPAKGCCADVLVLSADAEVTLANADPKYDGPDSALDAIGSQAGWAAVGVRATAIAGQRPPPGCPPEPLYLLNRALLI